MSGRPLAFPRALRPIAVRRRRRGRRRVLAALVVPPLVALGLLQWRVESVTVSACRGLPASACRSLRTYQGTPIPLLKLDEVRRLAETWPGIDAVEARLELPGKLVVTAHPAPVAGSRATGSGWHAVGPDGSPGSRLEGPVPPVLEQYPAQGIRLRRGLAIARRLSVETGRRVLAVRRILPDDVEVRLGGADAGQAGAVVHVAPGGSRAESWWAAQVRQGGKPGRWADLRENDRAVVGGVGGGRG